MLRIFLLYFEKLNISIIFPNVNEKQLAGQNIYKIKIYIDFDAFFHYLCVPNTNLANYNSSSVWLGIFLSLIGDI